MPMRTGNQHAHVEGAEVAGNDTGQYGQRCAALAGCGHDLVHVLGLGAGEDLGELGDEHRSQRAAADDHGELPPDIGHRGKHAVFYNLQVADQQVAHHKRSADAQDGGDPDQSHERLFEIELFLALIFGGRNGLIDEIGKPGAEVHEEAHGKNPDDQFALDGFFDRAVRAHNGQRDKGDQRNAGNAVGLETVRRGADAVARVVAGTVGDNTGVAGVVFLDLEDDLHEVGADVGDLGEDAAGDAECRCAQGLTDGESQEAVADDIAGHEEQNDDHHDQFKGDEEQPDAHAGAKRNIHHVPGLARQRGKGGTGVGIGVDRGCRTRPHSRSRPCRRPRRTGPAAACQPSRPSGPGNRRTWQRR